MVAAQVTQAFGKAAPDGKTIAKEAVYAQDGEYDKWEKEWNSSLKSALIEKFNATKSL